MTFADPLESRSHDAGASSRHPKIVQGGMGTGVSNWFLANVVARHGQLGVVSGTVIDGIVARRLQNGDPGGHMRRALASFPFPDVAARVVRRYYVPGGIGEGVPYRRIPTWSLNADPALVELTVCANYAEVWLAREGHTGLVGINYLEKIQTPHLASLYGAMLAGVDYVIMGAGIPVQIPGVLNQLTEGLPASMRVHVEQSEPSDDFRVTFDPCVITGGRRLDIRRPCFVPIISSATLGEMLISKSSGVVDGFVVEGPTAGGHNSPPRGKAVFNEKGEPVYGPRDRMDFERMRSLGLPFWVAGSYGSPEKLKEAFELGAVGVQVGTAFALCNESGLDEYLKRRLIDLALEDRFEVLTDPLASSSGFPFKVAQIEGTLSDREVYEARERVCDMGYLRRPYKKPDGSIGYRCFAEPVASYLAKGGAIEDTVGRKCLCNSLLANIGLGQVRKDGSRELPLVTLGDDASFVKRILTEGRKSYSAVDVIAYLLGKSVDEVRAVGEASSRPR